MKTAVPHRVLTVEQLLAQSLDGHLVETVVAVLKGHGSSLCFQMCIDLLFALFGISCSLYPFSSVTFPILSPPFLEGFRKEEMIKVMCSICQFEPKVTEV